MSFCPKRSCRKKLLVSTGAKWPLCEVVPEPRHGWGRGGPEAPPVAQSNWQDFARIVPSAVLEDVSVARLAESLGGSVTECGVHWNMTGLLLCARVKDVPFSHENKSTHVRRDPRLARGPTVRTSCGVAHSPAGIFGLVAWS